MDAQGVCNFVFVFAIPNNAIVNICEFVSLFSVYT